MFRITGVDATVITAGEISLVKSIDFTDLQNQVIDDWENNGVIYFETDNVGFNPPDPSNYESTILPECSAILDDPMECVNVLGYGSIAAYVADNSEPLAKRKITFYMSGVLNKQWRQNARVS